MTAPASSVVAAQPPTTPASTMTAARPARRCRRIEGGTTLTGSRVMVLAPSPTTLSGTGAGPRLHHLGQHRVLGSERLHAPLGHHHQLVDAGERAGAMRDDDDDAAARAHAHNGLRQRLIAVGVEIGVGLVEHDQERIAVERAGQRDALPLSGRERRAAFADLRVVAVRQSQHHLVHAGGVRGGDHRLRVGVRLEAGDILRHRAGEQLDVLRQIADMAAERLRAPLVERGAVEPHLAACRPHTPTMARTSDDLPDALGPTMPSPWPGFSAKEASCTTTCCSPGGATVMTSTARALHGGGSGVFSSSAGSCAQCCCRRFQPCRAATMPFQWAMASSTGASARDVRIAPAMMIPALASCSITR